MVANSGYPAMGGGLNLMSCGSRTVESWATADIGRSATAKRAQRPLRRVFRMALLSTCHDAGHSHAGTVGEARLEIDSLYGHNPPHEFDRFRSEPAPGLRGHDGRAARHPRWPAHRSEPAGGQRRPEPTAGDLRG